MSCQEAEMSPACDPALQGGAGAAPALRKLHPLSCWRWRRESFELHKVSCISEVLSDHLALLLVLISIPLYYKPSTAPSFVTRDKRVFGGCIIWFGFFCLFW